MSDETKASYNEALCVFRDLLEQEHLDANDEYVRGGVNLIADLFGVVEQPVDERMDDVLADLRKIPRGADPSDLTPYGVKPYVHDPSEAVEHE